MATYTPNTTFASKDALPPGDSAKKILGADFDSEFTEIESVVNSKADASSPVLTGSGTAVNLSVSGTLNSAGTLQLGGTAITATAVELNYVDGVTSPIQTQLDAKQASGSYATASQGALADTAVQPNDAAALTSVTLGTWTISDSAGKLIFSNGSTRFSLSATGAIIAGDDITAFGTP